MTKLLSKIITLLIIALILLPQTTSAMDIKLGTREIAPFVINDNGKLTGFSIELWNIIRDKIGATQTDTKIYSNVSELIRGTASGESDVSIAAISVTSDREKNVDFSQPMFESGLGLLINSDKAGKNSDNIFLQIRDTLFNEQFFRLIVTLLMLVFVPASIIYYIERRRIDGFLDSKSWLKGVSEGYWWGITALVGQQEKHPATKLGKIFAVAWMFFGIIFISFFTAQITSNLTAQKLYGNINGVEDIVGKKVVTIKGSTASKYLDTHNIAYKEEATIAQAFKSIENNINDVFVYDKPALDYYASTSGKGKVETVGDKFTRENYGIALPTGSPLRKQINEALLSIQESGEYDKLVIKWFGK
jgi:polar amino acid transport system substrate-binding protein